MNALHELPLFGGVLPVEPARAEYPDAPGFKEKGGASEDAAKKIEPAASRLRRLTLEQFQLDAALPVPRGLTADECAALLGRPWWSIRPRVSELLRAGKISKTDQRRTNESGMTATVLRLCSQVES